MHVGTAPYTPIQLEKLDAIALIKYIKESEARYTQQIEEIKNEYLILKEKYDLLIYKRFVRSAEQLLADKTYPLLFDAKEIQSETAEDPKQYEFKEVKSHIRKKAGRRAIDPKIPRVERIVDIAESEKNCKCGSKLTRIGEETKEKLHVIPPKIYVEKIIRPKYACRNCEGTEDESKPAVRIAPVPPCIIPRSIASASLLSTIMTQKYQDHLPFYRQEIQFSRIGVKISRQDMANWQQQVYDKIKPVFDLLKETLKSGPVIQMDETPVQVMGEEGRADTLKSYMWLARGGPPEKKVILYNYRRTRGAYHARDYLEGYKGYLQTDGYQGYGAALSGLSQIKQVGCFAHARRKFFDAAKGSPAPQSAEEGIKHIRKLYELERNLREQNLKEDKFLVERKKHAEPILLSFRDWLNKLAVEVPPSLLLGEAVSYSLNQWDKLVAYLESPYLTPDNNACENAIRPFVIGRKNWMFNKSPKGAESSCGMYSLIETAKQNNIEPFKYLLELFERAPEASTAEDWIKLLPWNIFKS